MNAGEEQQGARLDPRRPWGVFQARRDPHPPNPLRYAHTIWHSLSVIALAVLLLVVTFPARSVETDMLADVEQAKRDGFPQLPPGHATPSQIDRFIEDWEPVADLPPRSEIEALSTRVGNYDDDAAILNLGVMGSLGALVFIAAIAFTRALNNLYALGYGASALSQAWGFISWMLPFLSFIIPWRMVSETFGCAWSQPGGEPQGRTKWPQVVAAFWGISFIGLWLLNPVTVNWFISTSDIDGWANRITWTQRMLLWLPVQAFFTALVLAVVSIRQHSRYIDLDRAARSTA